MKQDLFNVLKLMIIVTLVFGFHFIDGLKILIQQHEFKTSVDTFKSRLVYYPLIKAYELEEVENLHSTSVAKKDEKKIYIYNTHQDELYQDQYSVLDASYYLQSKLQQYGFEVIVEDASFKDYRNQHQLTYNDSYQVSQYYLEQAIKKHGPFDLCIDLHRDSIPYDLSVLTINQTKYAKLMFVVAGSSKNYKQVLKHSQNYEQVMNEYQKGIMRNTMIRKEAYYNQFIQEHIVLIECGSDANYFDEVKNSLDYLAKAIKQIEGNK